MPVVDRRQSTEPTENAAQYNNDGRLLCCRARAVMGKMECGESAPAALIFSLIHADRRSGVGRWVL